MSNSQKSQYRKDKKSVNLKAIFAVMKIKPEKKNTGLGFEAMTFAILVQRSTN